MSVMISEVYDALREAGASDEKARKAAEALAGHDSRLTKLDTLATVTVGLLAALLVSHLALWVKLGELASKAVR